MQCRQIVDFAEWHRLLVVKLEAAEVIGLTVPPTLLARADEVIE